MIARPIRRYERDVLEAIDNSGGLKSSFYLPLLAGWSKGSCEAGLHRLKTFGLVYKAGGILMTTESGKIALAIIRGQEAKARQLRRAA